MGIQAIGGILVDLDVVEHGDILGERANSNRVEVRGALEQLQRSHPLSPRSESTPEGDVMELKPLYRCVAALDVHHNPESEIYHTLARLCLRPTSHEPTSVKRR